MPPYCIARLRKIRSMLAALLVNLEAPFNFGIFHQQDTERRSTVLRRMAFSPSARVAGFPHCGCYCIFSRLLRHRLCVIADDYGIVSTLRRESASSTASPTSSLPDPL
ncbi:hypothetical protein PoB_000200500 [Plakobranchus ocellatus]|uniref:Secreted protein n=1 Tax=Plakobranchus ocellatus TaxID=259542 RepID=A0AAV3XXI4_9GAST|nr:hypothetical protein PoB_000200500 [Plakobranchus ocellatus]